ncbi:MAG: VanZ family protein [Pseudomonadota bacterium]
MRWAAVIVALAIAGIAVMPGAAGQSSLLGWDKLEHIAAFAALTLLIRGGWPNTHRGWVIGVLVLYGALIELVQSTDLVGRTPSILDLIANGIGMALGLALAWLLGRTARAIFGR